MLFKYRAKNIEGKEETGTVEAQSISVATGLLVKKQLFVVDIVPADGKNNIKIPFLSPKVNLKDKIVFTEQLAVMIRSGLSIDESVKSLQAEASNKTLATALEKVVSDIQSGLQFSVALAKHPKIFDQIYVSIVASGEQSGKLDEVLERLAKQMDKSYDLVAKVRGALIYPAVVTLALVAVAVFVLVFILPKLKSIFIDSGVSMPAITRAIMGLGDLLTNYWYYFLIVIVFIVAGLIIFGRTPFGHRFFDKMMIKLPVFGTLFRKSYIANFSRTFSSLSASGLPILEIFKVVKDVIPNILYTEEISKMAKDVENGIQLSKVLRKSELFPSMVAQLAMVGEKSGRMDEVFDTLANFYEREVENIAKNLSTLIEPLMMLVLGAGVGLLVVAVLQPIYGLVGAV